MIKDTTREVGAAFTPLELSLLERLCSGNWSGSEEARAQLAAASWGGYSYPDATNCHCFLISVPKNLELPVIQANGYTGVHTLLLR